MAKFIIKGGKPLSGTIVPAGNKNEILKIMAAALLTSETVTITNVPAISDVKVMARILTKLGATVRFYEKGTMLKITCRKISDHKIDREEASKLRASNVFLGPLLARLGKVFNVFPGGDQIGPREMDAHFKGFRDLGAKVVIDDQKGFKIYYEDFKKDIAKDKNVFLYEPSVTATENIIMASALRPAVTVLENAAAEPHVRRLCEMLVKMGVEIEGIGSNFLKIKGREKLAGIEHKIGSDHIDVGTFMILALITGGELRIQNVIKNDLKSIIYMMESLGAKFKFEKDDLIIPAEQNLKVVDAGWSSNKGIYSQPWPSFPTDLMSVMIVLATQVEGSTLFFEKMYPGRMFFANYLNGMGANIIMCDPHRIVVNGKTQLAGRKLLAPDLRAGMAYVAAALCASGQSVIDYVEHIDRGYPKMEERLGLLGADIVRER